MSETIGRVTDPARRAHHKRRSPGLAGPTYCAGGRRSPSGGGPTGGSKGVQKPVGRPPVGFGRAPAPMGLRRSDPGEMGWSSRVSSALTVRHSTVHATDGPIRRFPQRAAQIPFKSPANPPSYPPLCPESRPRAKAPGAGSVRRRSADARALPGRRPSSSPPRLTFTRSRQRRTMRPELLMDGSSETSPLLRRSRQARTRPGASSAGMLEDEAEPLEKGAIVRAGRRSRRGGRRRGTRWRDSDPRTPARS